MDEISVMFTDDSYTKPWYDRYRIPSKHCSNCGCGLYHGQGRKLRDDDMMCEECYKVNLDTFCYCCSEPIMKYEEKTETAEGFVLCETCMHKEYVVCNCGRMIVPAEDVFNSYRDKEGKKHYVCEVCLKEKRKAVKK